MCYQFFLRRKLIWLLLQSSLVNKLHFHFTPLEVDGKLKHYDNKATLSDVSKIWKPDFSLKQPKRTVYKCDCGANVFKP